MKKHFLWLVLPALAGCLSSAPRPAVNWLLDPQVEERVAAVSVAVPYDSTRIAVLRADGSVAFDAFNVFAAKPSALLKAAVVCPREKGEVIVRRLALDCRRPGLREARVELLLLADGKAAEGAAAVDAASGNYSAAFAQAFEQALREARKTAGK